MTQKHTALIKVTTVVESEKQFKSNSYVYNLTFEDDLSKSLKKQRKPTQFGGIEEIIPCVMPKDWEAVQLFRKKLGQVFQDATELSQAEMLLKITLPPSSWISFEDICQVAAEVLGLASYYYEFDYETSVFKSKSQPLQEVCFILPENMKDQKSQISVAAQKGLKRAQAYNFARYLGDRPANTLIPEQLVLEASAFLKDNVKKDILDQAALKKQGFGGMIVVGKGSTNPPYLGIFDYKPKQDFAKTVVLVGKGLTFDTGGYTIKSKMHHNEMKYDMCGAANVLAALKVISEEEWPVRVIALLGCAENTIGDDAQRPGDVYRAWNGKTVDVYNTDAEGRLVLADLLSFAETFSPDAIVDIGTLTGGASSIAGNMAGIVCVNRESTLPIFKKACARAGEKFVNLEVLPEALENMKGAVSDYVNMHKDWGTGAPTMQAAAFLQAFLSNKERPWLHLDIANVAWGSCPQTSYMFSKGANAYGARAMVEWVKLFSAEG